MATNYRKRAPAQRLERKMYREPMSGCWLWEGMVQNKGYGLIRAAHGPMLAHRLSWEIANGPIPSGLFVLHRCDVPCCINPAHLFLGTHADNMRDMRAKGRGRSVRGERHVNAKLTDLQVQEIRIAIAAGRTQRSIASEYGVSKAPIWRIASGKRAI